MSTETKCPFAGGAGSHTVSGAQKNAGWWPQQLNLKMLHQQSSKSEARSISPSPSSNASTRNAKSKAKTFS